MIRTVISFIESEFNVRFQEHSNCRTYFARLGKNNICLYDFDDYFKLEVSPGICGSTNFNYDFDHQKLREHIETLLIFNYRDAKLIFCNNH